MMMIAECMAATTDSTAADRHFFVPLTNQVYRMFRENFYEDVRNRQTAVLV